MNVEVLATIIIILAIVYFIDKFYKKVDLEAYSPVWEYFLKATLYGFITIITLFYRKDSFTDVTILEWAIVAVSLIEGFSNYINYAKEVNKRKHKAK